MPYTVSIGHIDTCLSCYLQDHHTRPGELLIGVPVSRETTYGNLLARLKWAWGQADLYEDFDVEVIEQIEADFERAFSEMMNAVRDRLSGPFDEGIDPDDGSDEPAQAWFLVTYMEDDEDEEEGAAHEPETTSEDEADAAVAVKRLAELSMNPKSTLSGEELIARLDGWLGTGSPDRYYFGFVEPGTGRRVVTVQPKDVFFGPDLPGCHGVRNHSPSGFAWGYPGSGPAQLALAILCDAVGASRALPLYQRFKDAVVATWPPEGNWSITHGEVLAHVSAMEAASGVEGA